MKALPEHREHSNYNEVHKVLSTQNYACEFINKYMYIY